MKLISIYKSLADETRLRILSLLGASPLCVCHLQHILDKPQVKISQHLSYLKRQGMVVSHRHQQWMIYSLPPSLSPQWKATLECLRDCVPAEPLLRKDRERLEKLMGCKNVQALLDEGCCTRLASSVKPPRRKKSA